MEQRPQDPLAASTAILAAVSAATIAAGAQKNDAPVDPKREFGTATYERVLFEGQCHCVEKTTRKLKVLDDIVHVWVRDARPFRHGLESTVPYFSLRVASSVPIQELRVLVQKEFTALSSYRKEVDGELQLCFDDRILDDDDMFSTYLSGSHQSSGTSERRKKTGWPKPFAGILWVLPWRPARKQPLQWGGGESSTGSAQPSRAKQ